MPRSNGSYRDPIPLNRLLDTNGDGTGTKNAIGNYLAAPEIFFIAPEYGTVYTLTELAIHIVDNASFSASGYGGLAALTNGVVIQVSDNNEILFNLTNGTPIKSNDHFMHVSSDFKLINFGGGSDAIIVSFKEDAFGMELNLDGSQGHKLEIILNDNFAGMVNHHFIAHGNE